MQFDQYHRNNCEYTRCGLMQLLKKKEKKKKKKKEKKKKEKKKTHSRTNMTSEKALQ